MAYDAVIERPPVEALIELRGEGETWGAFAEVLDLALPRQTGRVASAVQLSVLRLGPDTALVRAPAAHETRLEKSLEGRIKGYFGAVTVVSDAYALFRIAGPDAREVLAQGVGIDLHPAAFPAGACARCGFAKTAAVLQAREATDEVDVLVDATLERYAELWFRTALGPP